MFPIGFQPMTCRLEGDRSMQLSYENQLLDLVRDLLNLFRVQICRNSKLFC